MKPDESSEDRRAEFVWVTETSDPHFHWTPVEALAGAGRPLVIYSKNRVPISFIKDHPRVAVGLTITGWGGTWLEPGVEPASAMADHFNALADAAGGERVRLRVDPGIPTGEGLARAVDVLKRMARPVRTITSIIQRYKGQDRVFARLGIDEGRTTLRSGRAFYAEPAVAEWWLRELLAARPDFAGRMAFCGMPYDVPGAERSGCVDEDLLRAIGVGAFKRIAPGRQRPGCACVILKKQAVRGACPHGCLYCYAHKEHLKSFR